jgi:hypothetical protein
MKLLLGSFAFWSFVLPLLAQENGSAGMNVVPAGTAISGPIADGTPSPSAPAPKPVAPNFTVKSTFTHQAEAQVDSGVPGLPPVKKMVNVTVNLVEDPHLPDPPPPLPALDISDPAVQARMAAIRRNPRKTVTAYISATVYDHSRTFLRWWWQPGGGEKSDEFNAWSNLDFNDFSGFARFTSNGRDYALLMGIGNQSTGQNRKLLARTGRIYQEPEHPPLPQDGPGYVLTMGDPSNTGAIATMDALHDLYRVEGERLKAARAQREIASKEREDYLRLHPPVPEDVTISFWKRDSRPSAPDDNAAADSAVKGGAQ